MEMGIDKTIAAIVVALTFATGAGVANAADANKEQKMGMMQEQMLKMHEQMHKITDAKSPQERETLMQEHRDMMKQHMMMMRSGMKGGGMMNKKPGPGGKGEAATEKGSAKPDEHQH